MASQTNQANETYQEPTFDIPPPPAEAVADVDEPTTSTPPTADAYMNDLMASQTTYQEPTFD
eukprot:CAMPEP_0119569520 /NCGR_PEP_ID=MMETSP1352-20130426/41894_1 /TAXON_ID=265584 /ORGANISM="Stauroneis constricta, Strain CCMP1120" /LENGTH=61 /DNA_ID=CAMNT_0007619083 /DNA_START=1 /DNA_END=183 /DNA_ORIENTATION=-